MSEKVNLKRKVFGGMIWRFGERITAQLVTFIVSVVLARLLSPDDYGAVALVTVFITIANVFVSNGLGNSLIQGKNIDNVDFSSAFYFNLLLSLILYGILFFIAPFVAAFYSMPILSPVLRVLGIRIIIAGINSIQHAYVSRHMMFKRFFISTLFGTVISGVVGIVLAYSGAGIWALVAQYLTNTTIDTIVLWFVIQWKPDLIFSLEKLKSLVSYGWKLLLSGLIYHFCNELANLIIGKKYTSSDLAYFTKAKQIPGLIVTNVNAAISGVLFPAMSKVQDDKERVRNMTRRSIQVSSFVMLPLLLGLAAVAEPLVGFLFTDKWTGMIPFLRLYCLFYMIQPIQTANLEAIKAIGRSDEYLRLEIIKRSIYIVVLLICVPFGVYAIAIGNVVSSYIRSFINAYPNKKLIGYSFGMQLLDLLPALVLSLIMAFSVWYIDRLLFGTYIVRIIIDVVIGVAIYLLLSLVFNRKCLKYVIASSKSILNRKKVTL